MPADAETNRDEHDAALRREYEESVRRTKARMAASKPGRMAASKPGRMDDIRVILVTPDAFGAWLAHHQPDDIVGDTVNPDESAIANFLWDTLGVYTFAVNPIVYM